MKRFVWVWVLILALALTACGANAEVEALEEELAGLHQRLDELEAENAALRAQLEEAVGQRVQVQAYLDVLEWEHAEGMLLINAAYARVMNLPAVNGLVELPEAICMVMAHNGTMMFSELCGLEAGEGENALEGEIEAFGTELPELAEGDVLEVYLEVTMPTGEVITAWGPSWDYCQGELIMTAG